MNRKKKRNKTSFGLSKKPSNESKKYTHICKLCLKDLKSKTETQRWEGDWVTCCLNVSTTSNAAKHMENHHKLDEEYKRFVEENESKEENINSNEEFFISL